MTFKYGSVSPTSIKYGNTELTVLKYGTTAVWGKPYSLSISAGANTSVTVIRTSSPNQHASTGTLSSGSVIYYGDVLTINYSVSSGYAINAHTVNGTTFTSGQSFTVTGAISVVTSAVASASWKTVWTGSMDVANSPNITASAPRSWDVSISGIVASVPTRITISTVDYYLLSTFSKTLNINSALTTSCGVELSGLAVPFAGEDSTYIRSGSPGLSIDQPTTAGKLPIHDYTTYLSFNGSKTVVESLIITKIEQYY